MLRGEIHRRRVSLQTQLATNLPAPWGDRIQLQQVLLNLLMNGIEALRGMTEKSQAKQTSAVVPHPLTMADKSLHLAPLGTSAKDAKEQRLRQVW